MSESEPQLRDLWWGVTLVVGAALYRPLVLWAENAWDLSSPESGFILGLAGAIPAVLALTVIYKQRRRVVPASLALAAFTFIVFNWRVLAPSPWVWAGVAAIVSFIVFRFVPNQTLRRSFIVILVVTVVAPAAQVVVGHMTHRVSYPLADVSVPETARPRSVVEDVLVVIVDSYPMLNVARDWFEHNTTSLVDELTTHGFVVPYIAWSHNTFTGLAVPTMLQLQQVVEPPVEMAWGNRRASYDIIRGESLVARTLQDAGYRYTHIESGWDGGTCGEVDECLASTWLNESTWSLLEPSLVGTYLSTQYGSAHAMNTLAAVEHLKSLTLFDDGTHDYVYAHLLLPHAPYTVDSGCNLLPAEDRDFSETQVLALRKQLACVDSLLVDIAGLAGDRTAVLVAGDHGTGTRGQIRKPPTEWTNADIAERLGAFLAYRLPTGCNDTPTDRRQTNLQAMRWIMECSVDARLPESQAAFMLGADQPQQLTRDRLAKIEAGLASGDLLP